MGNIISYLLRLTLSIKPGRVMCWAYNFKQYGCNPRYLSEYLLEHHPDMEIYWVFRRGVDVSAVDPRIKVVRFRSWQYYKLLATAEFMATNVRTDPFKIYWHKRPGQKYMMLWHAGVALKRIERDAEDKLGYSYLQRAKHDSKVCDLMISGSAMHTELIHRAFWYDGEVLECGIPRNDLFFHAESVNVSRRRIAKHYGISEDDKIVLYAPTFRNSGTIEPYRIDWSRVMPELCKMLGAECVSVIVRMHPNLIGKVDTSSLVSYEGVYDGTMYHDMQEMLAASDLLITDYSSSMFDFSMQGKPCLLYATDVAQYDRGYYFNFRELPYPLAENEEELLSVIERFDKALYEKNLNDFLINRVGVKECGNASERLAQWMRKHSI
ncbi:MAG: CDP-glycerol glycerophosphotransferase family protein [Alistipes sp.]|nr:CDP-glycerol glycerophosphotransferase family protein [Alistipes sp.]